MHLRTALLIPASLLALFRPTAAQQWQSASELELIGRAVETRVRRDADTVLAGWQAVARGMVRFTAEIDHGHGPIERVIRADELRVEVYGEAPNRSKQVITAWRDTSFQPTGIVYHRDHLGIIANDFGPVIRLGEGEEVRDVPHPLSPAGGAWYDFAMGDTLVVAAPSGRVRVVQVRVRPRDPTQAGIVGSMLIDADRAALVRLSFTFTAASYRDATVADITVMLENALNENERWLPWRQSIAIRRASPLVVLPLATVIRADWVIDDYQLGLRHPPERFRGMAIEGLRLPGRDSTWTEPWASPPDSLEGSVAAQLVGIREYAATSVHNALLVGLPELRLLADGGASRFLRVNRVQGVAIGAGARWQTPSGLTIDASGAIATATGRLTGTGTLSRMFGHVRLYFSGGQEIRDMHTWPRRSGLANSFSTLVDGSDAGDWYQSRRQEVGVEIRNGGIRARYALLHERIDPVTSRFTALNGVRETNPPFGMRSGVFVVAEVSMATRDGQGLWLTSEGAGVGVNKWLRFTAQVRGQLPGGLEGQLRVGIGTRQLPAHRAFVAGGAGSLPGTVPRVIGGRQLLLVELARPFQVALPAPVGPRLASNALNSRLTPFVAVGMAREPVAGLPWAATGEAIPVLGARLDLWGPLLRLEAGWALRTGGLSIMLDAHPDWWPML